MSEIESSARLNVSPAADVWSYFLFPDAKTCIFLNKTRYHPSDEGGEENLKGTLLGLSHLIGLLHIE